MVTPGICVSSTAARVKGNSAVSVWTVKKKKKPQPFGATAMGPGFELGSNLLSMQWWHLAFVLVAQRPGWKGTVQLVCGRWINQTASASPLSNSDGSRFWAGFRTSLHTMVTPGIFLHHLRWPWASPVSSHLASSALTFGFIHVFIIACNCRLQVMTTSSTVGCGVGSFQAGAGQLSFPCCLMCCLDFRCVHGHRWLWTLLNICVWFVHVILSSCFSWWMWNGFFFFMSEPLFRKCWMCNFQSLHYFPHWLCYCEDQCCGNILTWQENHCKWFSVCTPTHQERKKKKRKKENLTLPFQRFDVVGSTVSAHSILWTLEPAGKACNALQGKVVLC